MERYLSVREDLKLDDRILDVEYENVRHDPMSIIREAYARSPYTLDQEADQLMLDWHHENVQGKHGSHEYSLDEFGLSEADIEENFGTYMRRFLK